jgi:ribulose-5-phosphate 4-epimerase/fuculose-1-phosphate aldolase
MSHVAAANAHSARYVSAEWQTRIHLAAVLRLLSHFGMADGIRTHASARVPEEPDTFLINPNHLMFHEVTASSLIKLSTDGEVLDAPEGQIVLNAHRTHGALYSARSDVNCIIHTHTEAGVAVSCLADGILPFNHWALEFYDRVARHTYEGVTLDHNERQRMVRDLGKFYVLLLNNHGSTTLGRSIPETFKRMHNLEKVCRTQLSILASGSRIIPLRPDVCEKTAHQYAAQHDALLKQPLEADVEWQALIRLAEHHTPGFDD